MVAHCALDKSLGKGAAGVRRTLERLRCIQVDPLDSIGTNADLVVMARVDGVGRGDVWRHLFPHHAFEHFAKERCILPASAFPHYRERGHAAETPWWGHGERARRVPRRVVEAVLAEVETRGPLTPRDLQDHGKVEPLDWSGWKGTASAATMALEMLWTRCEIVVAGRTDSGAKLYATPRKALGTIADAAPDGNFARWALRERVRAAGLLARAAGATWSMLASVRKSRTPAAMIRGEELVEVLVEGSGRPFLATPEFFELPRPRFDDRVRILGPLDPLLWDRNLVRRVFDFDYVWEVYKPARLRRWGWYVCPLLYRDQLVGRVEAVIERQHLLVRKLWIESEVPDDRVRDALDRHARACGLRGVRLPKRAWRQRR